MKNILLAFILLFALSSQPLLGSADASPEQVVDTSGKKLRADANYYIIPSLPYSKFRPYTGLALASVDKPYCPLDVVAVTGYHGLPLTFTPINPKKGVIRVNTDLNIKFSTRTSCPHQSTVWKLDNFDFAKRQWFVTIGGVVGNPSLETIHNWFKIEKYDGAYKLVHCPTFLQSPKHLCKNVGVFVDEKGNKRLALTDVPLKVKFQQAYVRKIDLTHTHLERVRKKRKAKRQIGTRRKTNKDQQKSYGTRLVLFP